MSSGFDFSTLAKNDDKLHLSEYDLFDRVINLKLYLRNNVTKKEDIFVIRSDYEIEYLGDTVENILSKGTKLKDYVIKKCAYKPSIKIHYTQVSGGTSIALDIFINNFFALTKGGEKLRSFSNGVYNLYKVEILMGYLGQFEKCLGIVNGDISNLTYESLFNFDNIGHGVTKITLSEVEYVKTDKLPPDSTIHVHGYVGNTIITQLEDNTEATYDAVKALEAKNLEYSKESADSDFEKIFKKYITKRFLNQSLSEKDFENSFDENGYLKDTVADSYGTQVFCSPAVKLLELPSVKGGDGTDIESNLSMNLSGNDNNVNSALQKICEYTKTNIQFRRLNSGNFIAYLTEELSTEEVTEDGITYVPLTVFSEAMSKYINDNECSRFFKNRIPAVYNINIDAVATIVCPFFTWIEPFQKLEFDSRYFLSSLVSYYAEYTSSVTLFTVINLQVSFATVEDVNEMQIIAVAEVGKSLDKPKGIPYETLKR